MCHDWASEISCCGVRRLGSVFSYHKSTVYLAMLIHFWPHYFDYSCFKIGWQKRFARILFLAAMVFLENPFLREDWMMASFFFLGYRHDTACLYQLQLKLGLTLWIPKEEMRLNCSSLGMNVCKRSEICHISYRDEHESQSIQNGFEFF